MSQPDPFIIPQAINRHMLLFADLSDFHLYPYAFSFLPERLHSDNSTPAMSAGIR